MGRALCGQEEALEGLSTSPRVTVLGISATVWGQNITHAKVTDSPSQIHSKNTRRERSKAMHTPRPWAQEAGERPVVDIAFQLQNCTMRKASLVPNA